MESEKLKIVVFGPRHTGQGPLGRAWGQTDADLPDLQPVVIYEREIERGGKKMVVAAWILSLDPQFDYMRTTMYMKADAFIYTFDVADITGKSLQFLDPFINEVHAMFKPAPPEVLVGSVYDPTLSMKPAKTISLVQSWREAHGNVPYFEIDLTEKKSFFTITEQVFEKVIALILEKNQNKQRK